MMNTLADNLTQADDYHGSSYTGDIRDLLV